MSSLFERSSERYRVVRSRFIILNDFQSASRSELTLSSFSERFGVPGPWALKKTEELLEETPLSFVVLRALVPGNIFSGALAGFSIQPESRTPKNSMRIQQMNTYSLQFRNFIHQFLFLFLNK